MKTYLRFGIESDQLDAARVRLEGYLGIKMALHYSDYRGGDYYRLGDAGGEHFILQRNFNEIEEEWMEPSCQEYGLLLYIGETGRAELLRTALKGFATLISNREA